MDPIWIVFLFLMGACVGSFLNVVIWRLPRGESLAFPGSHCPKCGRAIRWYDNIPMLSWLALRGRCRFCKASISVRYLVIEAVTALLVVGLYVGYFIFRLRDGAGRFEDVWPTFTAHAALICGLLVCAAVDIEMWIVPLEVTWVVAAIGVAASAYRPHAWMPAVSPATAGMSLSAMVGLAVAMVLMRLGYIQPSFLDADDKPEKDDTGAGEKHTPKHTTLGGGTKGDSKPGSKTAALKAKTKAKPAAVALSAAHGVNPRIEVLRELIFLAPAIILAFATWQLLGHMPAVSNAWQRLLDPNIHPLLAPHLAGACAAVFGYLIGGLWVWGTRILGTLGFGKEAMGMGDVHILAAVGAVTGYVVPSLAFFVAPVLGLLWAIYLWLRHNQKELPYGPWLAAASLIVMVFYDQFGGLLKSYAATLQIITH